MLNCVSIGCKVNQAEMEEIRSKVCADLPDPESLRGRQSGTRFQTQICVLNTCAVTSVSAAKSRKLIRRLIREYPHSRLIVTGCYAQAELEVVRGLVRSSDIVVLNNEKNRIPEIVGSLVASPTSGVNAQRTTHNVRRITHDIRDDVARTRVFLKIQDGCKNFCSYCIVPFLRSQIWCMPPEEVESEMKRLVRNGYQEIVLTGVNLGSYPCLVELIERVSGIEGLKRLRLSSIELNDVSDELIDRMAKNPVICPHLHIPLQSGSDRILKKMNRNYKADDFIRRIEFIKGSIENPSITTDIIVGFPGESADDFQQTLGICRRVGFSKVHIFPFSARKGTRAEEMKDRLPPETIKKRFILLNNLAQKLSLRYRYLFVGKEEEVLVEDAGEGFTQRYVRVKVEGNPQPNQIVRVRIKEVGNKYVRGIVV
ncbi:MAG: tRNA (N(6)-L-threonylcarbamoyladenosine(37)-C(2))-methylthiotransferase MtaB [Planctomycetota bacterium]|nr:tRNA (N(6)-L-threonylcarbamoyladenosine(37)-C(2))-methylthiotransferase MtaB [Planctomycetota bacterium]